jgi:hypothetical protein
MIGPTPFFSQSSPDHSTLPRIDFSYYEILGPDICSLICEFISAVLHLMKILSVLKKNQKASKNSCDGKIALIFKEVCGTVVIT